MLAKMMQRFESCRALAFGVTDFAIAMLERVIMWQLKIT